MASLNENFETMQKVDALEQHFKNLLDVFEKCELKRHVKLETRHACAGKNEVLVLPTGFAHDSKGENFRRRTYCTHYH